ncbi:MAG: SDR family NAD(P)-dependent oxidoreductase, partial [Fidelibacterota bacterium]
MEKVALITGGARGIGLGIAQALAREGYKLAIDDICTAEDFSAAGRMLQELGAQVVYCQADISDRRAREALLEEVKEAYGRLDVLVNNAGVAPLERMDILKATEESFDRLVRINLKGPYFLTQAVANWLVEQKKARADFSGCIINITSISAVLASPE